MYRQMYQMYHNPFATPDLQSGTVGDILPRGDDIRWGNYIATPQGMRNAKTNTRHDVS